MKRRSGVKKRRTEHQATIYPIASCLAKNGGILGIFLLPMKKKWLTIYPIASSRPKMAEYSEKVQRREQEPREEVKTEQQLADFTKN